MVNNFQIHKMVKGRWDRSTLYHITGGKKVDLEGKSKTLPVHHKGLEKVLDHRIIRKLLLLSFLIILLHLLLLSVRHSLCQITSI